MRVAIVAVLLALAGAIPAHAQTKEPLPTFVVDARLLIAKLTEDAVTAGDLGLAATALPTTALGGAIGADVYFLRDKKVKLGLGGEAVIGRATSNVTDATGAVIGPRIERRVQGFAGTFSLNFGHRQGWSYISAGLGPFRLHTFTGDLPTVSPSFELTQNFGVGARWFATQHVAFCFDLRFYLTKPAPAEEGIPGRSRERLLLFSTGISIK